MPHFLEYLLPALNKYSSRTLLKLFTGTPGAPSWKSVTYQMFIDDLERVAAHWIEPLKEAGLQPQDVIGLWITGEKYTDLIHLYALARIGYVPQMLNKAMATLHDAVPSVLSMTQGKAILYDPFFSSAIASLPYKCIALVNDLNLLPLLGDRKLPAIPDVPDDALGVIFHTSGTTGGRPKPVPETHKWLRCQAQVQWPAIWQGGDDVQGVVNNLGSFANVGSATTVSYLGWSGQCLVQTSKPDIDANEFMALIAEAGMNWAFLYAPWLSKLINIAKTDEKVLAALKGLVEVTYTGAALNPSDEAWLVENGVKATAMYATTESGCCLVSDVNNTAALPSMHIIKGINVKLIPATSSKKEVLDGDAASRLQGGKLFDLFVPADAPNCPHPTIRNRPDGHITGDLFEETAPGMYAFRGRNDDWIRTGKHYSFCDTKSIEDNILHVCSDLVGNCVVAGHYKPGIVLFVEPLFVDPSDNDAVVILKEQILERHAPFNTNAFIHERLQSKLQIVVVHRGTLPRTTEKGNIRRKAAEDEHAEILDTIYAQLKV
ncbi:acetyl-CoA synthetase-like protein [Pholiota conissans]|uniref:Acetyl-CoA synthetase-like protein n=1 Tax=Pholiota conissans TaxID=109636 RepID=A0A9P5YYK8_9AGAR|nr:acetyl-CoA synthetase-like protein [Pholiota conissans]